MQSEDEDIQSEYDDRRIQKKLSNNLNNILDNYDAIFESLEVENNTVSLLMPGAGPFPGLKTVIDRLINANSTIQQVNVDLIDPQYQNVNPTQLINKLSVEIKNNYSKMDIQITFHAKTTQSFCRENPHQKYDVIVIENPICSPIHDATLSLYYSMPLSEGSRAALLSTLMYVKKGALIVGLNYTKTEANIVLGLLDLGGVDCSKVSLPKSWNWPISLFPCPSRALSATGFVVKAQQNINAQDIAQKSNNLVEQDKLRLALLGLSLVVSVLNPTLNPTLKCMVDLTQKSTYIAGAYAGAGFFDIFDSRMSKSKVAFLFMLTLTFIDLLFNLYKNFSHTETLNNNPPSTFPP